MTADNPFKSSAVIDRRYSYFVKSGSASPNR